MSDVLIITGDDLKTDDRAAVDEWVRDVAGSLSTFVREAEALLSGEERTGTGADADAWGEPLGEDEVLPPLSDPEQIGRVERLKALLEWMRASSLLQ